VAGATGCKFTVTIGAGGTEIDSASLAALASVSATGSRWMTWAEGINEPNMDFGSGHTTPSSTVAIQQSLYAKASGSQVTIVGPSVVFGLPYPEGYITPAYLSDADLIVVNARCSLANAHLYPPSNVDMEDGSGRGGALGDVITGFSIAYGPKPVIITEWHPTLYNMFEVVNADGSLAYPRRLDPVYDCYYTACFFLSAFQKNIVAWFWYSLIDYGVTYLSGLFPQTGGVDARPAANVVQAMFELTGDRGDTKRTFPPGKLDFVVANLPSDTRTLLFQNSAGMFFLFIWRIQESPGGMANVITVDFPSYSVVATDYKISDSVSPRRVVHAWTGVRQLSVALDASAHLLVISK